MSRASEPFNAAVHSASRFDGSNSRTVMAEFRFKRFHLLVFFDHADQLFHFEQYEHRKRLKNLHRDGEHPVLDRFMEAMEEIVRTHINERRFQKHRGVNRHYLSDPVPGIRTFDPAKVPQKRDLFSRYKPFDPASHNEDDGTF